MGIPAPGEDSHCGRLCNDGLARACGSADDHRGALQQDVDGLRLEPVQLEGPHALDVRQGHLILARGKEIRHLHTLNTFTCLK